MFLLSLLLTLTGYGSGDREVTAAVPSTFSKLLPSL